MGCSAFRPVSSERIALVQTCKMLEVFLSKSEVVREVTCINKEKRVGAITIMKP